MAKCARAQDLRNHWAVTPEELARIPFDRRAVGYIRVSKVGSRGDDLISPELQKHSIQALADRDGLTVVYWIYDIDESGRSFTKRHVGDVCQGVRDKTWRYAILWKWSRWGRDLRESLIYLSYVEDEAGGLVRAATEDFDPTTSIGRFSRSQMLLIAQLQSDMISDGWKETHERRRRNGLPHTGRYRWGYQYDKRAGYTIDRELEPVVRGAYERYVAGKSHRSLAVELNERGLRSAMGAIWTGIKVARVMDTGFPAGLIREKQDTSRGRSIRSYEVWRKGSHEPIISEDVWEKYKERRAEQAALPPRSRTPTYALTGMMSCGVEGCGASMSAERESKSNRLNWTCSLAKQSKVHTSNRISNLRVMAEIKAWLAREAQGGDDVTGRARRMEAAARARSEADTLAKEAARLTRKRKRLVDLHTDGEIELEDYREKKAEVDAAIDTAQTGYKAALARERATGQQTVRAFGALLDEWDRFTPDDHRAALSHVLRHIVIMPGPYSPGKVALMPAWEE